MAASQGRGTFVNFSTPQRSQSQRSTTFFRKRLSTSKKDEGEDKGEGEGEGEEVLPYRPVKAEYVQLHVTADDFDVASARQLRIDEIHQPSIPKRTTSLTTRRETRTWPSPVLERKAGSCKFDMVPTLTRTPWEAARSERPGSSRWSRTSDRLKNLPRRSLEQLPREMLQAIVDHVESGHVSERGIDVLGMRRDLRSLCLVDKKWHRVAREHLYRDLWLPSHKTPTKKRWSRQQPKSRLRLLHDILRDNSGLSFLVHHIHFTTELSDEVFGQAHPSSVKISALDLLQDIIQRCYNLERLCGCAIPLTTTTLPLFNALATRSRLREHAWTLDSERAELPGLTEFISCHDQWSNLETLVIAADHGVDLGEVAVSAVLARLPSLKHLMVSGLHKSDFNNSTLLILPTLKSLRLENLAGVTDRGVEQLAFSRLAPSVERLRLVDLELVSLQTVSTLLSHLTRLKALAVVQETSPEAQTGVKFVGRGTSFASTSLRQLHWDCLIPGTALSLWAAGIQTGRFPALRRLCVPCDYEGVIQALCRPMPRMRLTQEDLQYLEGHTYMYERNLRVAQIQAQLRIRESRQQPSFNFIVQDESNEVQQTHVIGSFMGSLDSQIEYCLDAEVGSNALASFADVAWPWRNDGLRLECHSDLAQLF